MKPSERNVHELVSMLSEDAIFGVAAGGNLENTLEGLSKRRMDTYEARLSGTAFPRMTENYDAWLVQLSRALAPVSPPAFLPMMEVVREKVTLELGARGLRSLFSTKPSDKEVSRIKRLGTLTVRVLRAVFAADRAIDREEATSMAAVLASMGFSDEEATALYNEPPMPPETLDVYGDVEAPVAKAIVRGAFLAAAWDSIDPREEAVVRTIAQKLGVQSEDVEPLRAEALTRVEARWGVGLAAVDGIRFLLSDRVPGPGVTLAATVGTLLLPKRYREEALAHVGHGSPVVLAERHKRLEFEDRLIVLAILWGVAMMEDPSLSRRALLRARWERFSEDLGETSPKGRVLIDEWLFDHLSLLAKG